MRKTILLLLLATPSSDGHQLADLNDASRETGRKGTAGVWAERSTAVRAMFVSWLTPKGPVPPPDFSM